jgi:TPR repeat protein
MSLLLRFKQFLGAAAFVAASLVLVVAAASPGQAARHAFVVGVGDYDQKKNGLSPLNAPVFDAEAIAQILKRPNIGFSVDMLTDEAVKDKATFNAALEKFLARVSAGDEVVFYFSGHGIGLADKGNHFLLLDAKDQDTFIREERKKPGSARDLDTQEKENHRYEQYITEIAVSENAMEKAIKGRGADVVIIIADACRAQISGAKGLVPVNSLRLPAEPAKGTFRLYATRRGQVSYDSPANTLNQTSKKSERSSQAPKGKDDKKEHVSVNSLFTAVLLSQIVVPRQEINILFSQVKLEVRDRARSIYNKEQVPDYDDSLTSRFYFWQGKDNQDLAAQCSTADAELDRLRRGVAAGSIFADDIEAVRNKLAVCSSDKRQDFVEEISSILRLQEQGGGGTLATYERGDDNKPVGDPNDPLQQCDAFASSPLDQSRPQGIKGVDLQSQAIEGRASEERRLPAVDKITRALKACETAVQQRGRVARYKFNLGSAHYAMATLTDALNKVESLTQASRYFQEAVDLGYPAAYNALALMHQHGEYRDPADGKQLPPNRQKARELFQRGADLGHVLALYNLGLAYKNGGLGLYDDPEAPAIANQGAGKAFQYLSKAAESGFLPAMVETALVLKGDWGGLADRNPKRAAELLEIAASRGSWEAMYQLGSLYDEAKDSQNATLKPLKDYSEAIIWYARAAEAGDTRSQERLAEMLTEGNGLPAAQRDAAGRYWRLAADGGSMRAQMRLASLLRDGRLPFRPKLQGKPDGGAEEILRLYTSAFANGNPEAGLELARLYRTGFPKDRPSEVIPKVPETAVELLWTTMDRVRQARPTSPEANPMVEVYSGFELLAMQEAGEAKRSDHSELINEDQIDQLKTDYGDRSTLKFLNFKEAVQLARVNVTITCKIEAFSRSIAFWSWKRSVPPTDPQFEWFERYYECRESEPENPRKRDAGNKDKQSVAPETQGLKRVREFYKKQYEAWTKQRETSEKGQDEAKVKQRPQSFTDQIAALLTEEDGKSRRRR